jgi:hypothetical protein
VCQQVCDNNHGGDPKCPAMSACSAFEGIFANPGATTIPAGICQPTCDPIADNAATAKCTTTGSGSAAVTTCVAPLDANHDKTGTACTPAGSGSNNINFATGCYGVFSDGSSSAPPPPTFFTCDGPAGGFGSGSSATGNLVHRSPIAQAIDFINSCAPGYMGGWLDHGGSMQADCYAMCKPGNSYMGLAAVTGPPAIPAGGQPEGVAPHACNNNDARGVFTNLATAAGANGESCNFSWQFELDADNMGFHQSPTSDTLGMCIDHTKFQFDSNGDGMITAADKVLPACPTLPLTGSADPDGVAAQFGCVDSVTGAVPPHPAHSGTSKPATRLIPHLHFGTPGGNAPVAHSARF